jgi:hypothetical protein
MNLSEAEREKVEKWKAESPEDLTALKDILWEGGTSFRDDYDLQGHICLMDADSVEFDADEVADRFNLDDGEKLEKKQIEEYQAEKLREMFDDCCDGWVYHFYLYKLEISNHVIWIRTLHGDGGCLDSFDGPFESQVDCVRDASIYEMC